MSFFIRHTYSILWFYSRNMLRLRDMLLVVVAFAITTASARLHLAHHGLLQIHPSFRGDTIALYPSHHPDHDMEDMIHIQPQHEQLLYYSQEGHRRKS